jgi:hypothetical protein
VPEQTPTRWQEKAARLFPGAIIHNSGQFAVAVMDHVNVYLFDDFFETADFMVGHPGYRFYDLTEEPVRKPKVQHVITFRHRMDTEKD